MGINSKGTLPFFFGKLLLSFPCSNYIWNLCLIHSRTFTWPFKFFSNLSSYQYHCFSSDLSGITLFLSLSLSVGYIFTFLDYVLICLFIWVEFRFFWFILVACSSSSYLFIYFIFTKFDYRVRIKLRMLPIDKRRWIL